MPPARVGLGVESALYGHRAIHRYTVALARLLPELGADLEWRLFSYRFRRAATHQLPPASPPGLRHCLVPLPGRMLVWLWEHLDWPPATWWTGRLDLYHATTLEIPALPTRVQVVSTLHGVNYLNVPEAFPRRYVRRSLSELRRALNRSRLLIAVSRDTAATVARFAPEARGRLRVVPLGLGPEFFQADAGEDLAILDRLGIVRPYLLYVGALSRVKNLEALVACYEQARLEAPELGLVLAGPTPDEDAGWAAAVLGRAEGRLHRTGNLPQGTRDLPALYRQAEVLVHPSLSEGWTSPPLEGMACGTPVVAADHGSLRETVGESALLADPRDPAALAAQVLRLRRDASLRSQLVERGREHAGRFTWEAAARATLEVYREVLSS